MTDDPSSLLKRLIWWTGAFGVFLILLAAGAFGYALYDRREASQRAIDQRRGLCVEIEKLKDQRRSELQEDVVQSRQFLRDNPNGIQGIPAELIKKSIERNEARQAALAPIDCETFSRERATP